MREYDRIYTHALNYVSVEPNAAGEFNVWFKYQGQQFCVTPFPIDREEAELHRVWFAKMLVNWWHGSTRAENTAVNAA